MTRLIILIAVAFPLAGALHWLGLRRSAPPKRRAGAVKYVVYLGIALGFVGVGALGAAGLAALVALICAVGAVEIAFARRAAAGAGAALPGWVWAPYAAIATLAVAGAARAPVERTLFVFAVIATFDALCQVTGQGLGRTKLAPRVSPNKTVEGLVGGLAAAALTAAWLASLWPARAAAMALAALPMGMLALAGDLSASWIKRRAGLKDYDHLIPGHGGALDRFDGFLPNCAALGVIEIAERLLA